MSEPVFSCSVTPLLDKYSCKTGIMLNMGG